MKKVLFLLFAFASVSFADDMSGKVMLASYSALAAGLVLGIAALGGAIGMGNAASAALSGIARNPGLLVHWLRICLSHWRLLKHKFFTALL